MCLKTGCPRLVITQIISQLLILGNNNLKFSIEVSYIYSTYSSILYCMAYCMYFISRRNIFCYILFYLISGQATKKKNRHLSLQQLHPWWIRFVCRDSDYFWDSAADDKKIPQTIMYSECASYSYNITV